MPIMTIKTMVTRMPIIAVMAMQTMMTFFYNSYHVDGNNNDDKRDNNNNDDMGERKTVMRIVQAQILLILFLSSLFPAT